MVGPTNYDEAVGPSVDRLEHALVTLLRLGNLPRTHDRLVRRAGARIERGAYIVLAAIGDSGTTRLSATAKQLGIDVSTASRHVSRLCELGLLERTVDAADHRAAKLALNDAGRRALDEIRAARHEALAELLAEWSQSDLDRLARYLERLNSDLIDRVDAEQGDER